MGRRGRTSAVDEVADTVGAGVRRVAGQVQDVLGDAVPELSEQVRTARRGLARRLDPDPAPRRGRRFLGAGLLVVGAVAWALWEHLAAARADREAPIAAVPDQQAIRATPPGGAALAAGQNGRG
jgi:hypothetical protein